MEYMLIIVILIIILIILRLIIGTKIRNIKEIGENKELNELTNKFPENMDVCLSILKDLKNETVKVSENKESKTSLYIIATNTISIANIKDSFTRIQTIAHECIHSTQDKKLLWTNFLFSNFYLLYFIISIILKIFGVINNNMLQIFILLLFGFIHYMIRSFLETDAMTKARYVARDYMEKESIVSEEDINKIVEEYDKLNDMGIKFINFKLFSSCVIKVILYCIVVLIKWNI